MADRPTVIDRIDGWKEIARYLGRDVTTAIRWERQKGLPVHRVPGGKRQAVYCYAHEIEAWLGRGRASSSGLYVLVPAAEGPPAFETHPEPTSAGTLRAGEDASGGMGFVGRSWQNPWVAGLLLAVAAFSWILWPHTIRLGDETQITNDGAIKTHLVADGEKVYMGEWRSGRIAGTIAGRRNGVRGAVLWRSSRPLTLFRAPAQWSPERSAAFAAELRSIAEKRSRASFHSRKAPLFRPHPDWTESESFPH